MIALDPGRLSPTRVAHATALLLLAGTIAALAQMPDEPPPPGGGPGAGFHRNHPGEGMRGAMQLGPPGRWWDDPQFASDLALTHDQQTRMDAIFEANRGQLQSGFHALRQEEQQLENLAHARNPDEPAIDAEIDRIASAHAALEKSMTHMRLLLRKEMSPDQVAKLDARRAPQGGSPPPR